MDATAALQRSCYGGEVLEAAVPAGGGAVGVTSHRVLVLTPDGPGRRFRAVDRPNVLGVAAGTSGPTSHRDRGGLTGVAAVVLLVAGRVIDLGGLVQPIEAPAGTGLGGLFALVEGMIATLALVDEALTMLGLVALLVAFGSLGWWLRERDRVIELDVAGGDSVRVPVARSEIGGVERIREALDGQWATAGSAAADAPG